jgi:hypothetical protein
MVSFATASDTAATSSGSGDGRPADHSGSGGGKTRTCDRERFRAASLPQSPLAWAPAEGRRLRKATTLPGPPAPWFLVNPSVSYFKPPLAVKPRINSLVSFEASLTETDSPSHGLRHSPMASACGYRGDGASLPWVGLGRAGRRPRSRPLVAVSPTAIRRGPTGRRACPRVSSHVRRTKVQWRAGSAYPYPCRAGPTDSARLVRGRSGGGCR